MPLPYQVGHFRLLQPISDDGRTAVGVYADPYGRPVTIRTLSDAVARDAAAQQWFRQTAYASGPVLEVGDAPDGRPYVVTPAPGEPGNGSPKRRTWPIVVAICAVLVVAAGAVIAVVATRGDSDSDRAGSSPLVPSPASTSGSASAAPSGTPSSTPSSPAPPDPLGTPRVGECRNLSFAAGAELSDATPTVSCQQTHTALTYFVGKYPGNREDNSYAGFTCETALPQALGGSAAAAKLSAYSLVFYQPTKQQWTAGARWFRCDLVLPTPHSFKPLPATVSPLPGSLPDTLAACRDARGTTPCSEPHTMRAVATVTYSSAGRQRPSDSALERQAQARCPATATYYTWPGKGDWRLGARLGVCWQRTPH